MNEPSEIMMPRDKASTRKALRQMRDNLSPAERNAAETQSLMLLSRWQTWGHARVIASYLPHQSEFNPSCLTRAASAQGASIVYPRVTNEALTFHHWQSGDALEATIGAVNQPLANSPQVALSDIDLFITPMLACGDNGIRLGYGGGYYDRVFAEARGFRLGVGFSLQRIGRWDTEPHDQQLWGFLNESRLELFSPGH